GLECGADNFITKPYDPRQLVERVKAMIATRAMRQAGRLSLGVDIFFLGKKFTVTSEKEQILSLLVSTFEDIVIANRRLKASEAALQRAQAALQAHSTELARANKALEAFVYTASHDLKEPLRGIEAFSRIVLDEHTGGLDTEGRRYLDLVQSSAVRM